MVGASYSIVGATRLQSRGKQLPRTRRGTDHTYRPRRTSPSIWSNSPARGRTREHDHAPWRRPCPRARRGPPRSGAAAAAGTRWGQDDRQDHEDREGGPVTKSFAAGCPQLPFLSHEVRNGPARPTRGPRCAALPPSARPWPGDPNREPLSAGTLLTPSPNALRVVAARAPVRRRQAVRGRRARPPARTPEHEAGAPGAEVRSSAGSGENGTSSAGVSGSPATGPTRDGTITNRTEAGSGACVAALRHAGAPHPATRRRSPEFCPPLD